MHGNISLILWWQVLHAYQSLIGTFWTNRLREILKKQSVNNTGSGLSRKQAKKWVEVGIRLRLVKVSVRIGRSNHSKMLYLYFQ